MKIIQQILIILPIALITTAQNDGFGMNFTIQYFQKIINLAISQMSPNGIIIQEIAAIYKSKIYERRIGSIIDFPNQKYDISYNNQEDGYLFLIRNIKIKTSLSCNDCLSTNQREEAFQILVNLDLQLNIKDNGDIQLTKQIMKVDFSELNQLVQSNDNDQNPIILNTNYQLNEYIDHIIFLTNYYWNKRNNTISFYNIPITFHHSLNQIIQINDNQQKDFAFSMNINSLRDITQQLIDSQKLNGIIDNPNFPIQFQKALAEYNNFQIKIRFDQVPSFLITQQGVTALADKVVAELFSGTTRIYKIMMSLKFIFEDYVTQNNEIKIILKDGYLLQFNTQHSQIKPIDKIIMKNFITSMIKNQITKINEFFLNDKNLHFNILGLNYNNISFKFIQDYLIIESNLQV